jgi:dTDP-4-amino-4,6-dideoxygalactose transaminase
MISLYPRHYLDITTRDLLLSASGAYANGNARGEIESAEHDIGGDAMVTLSVRSAWDLALSAFNFPAGSEVIMSAVTIPDMQRIVEAHGLVVIPIDLDPVTMAPRLDLYRRAFNDKTCVVMLAHLLGGSFAVGPYADIADAHNVPLVEDRAQAFIGPHDWGSSRAAISLYSFGSIKTATALGGAVAIVRDSNLHGRMRDIHSQWPFQDDRMFARKAAKYLAVQGFKSPQFYAAIANVAARGELGLDGFISRTVKGFKASSTDSLLALLRQRPGSAQVSLLRKRLDTFDGKRLAARAERGELLREELSLVCEVAGREQLHRTHWLLAVTVGHPRGLIERLRAAGFDATQGASTIGALDAPAHRPEFRPIGIQTAMSSAVFLPAYPEMPSHAAATMLNVIFAFTVLRPSLRPAVAAA